MATITWDDFINIQEDILQDLREDGQAFGRAVASVHSDVVQRIFTDGLDANGNEIGNYSTKGPIWIDRRLPKPGKYESYADYKRKAFGVNHVNLKLTGQLQTDYANSLRQVSSQEWLARPKNGANIHKAQGNVERFDANVFGLTEEEKDKLVDIFEKELIAMQPA